MKIDKKEKFDNNKFLGELNDKVKIWNYEEEDDYGYIRYIGMLKNEDD